MKKLIIGALAIIGVLGLIAAVFISYTIANVDNKYTGQQLFDAVNDYRSSIHVQKLQLDQPMCNNLVERWEAIKNPKNGHMGLKEWLASNNLTNNPQYGTVGELYVQASTPQNAISWWLGSPGHKIALEKPELNAGCAYALEGLGIVIVGEKK